MPLYSIEKQVLQASINFWNGSGYLFINMPALKTNWSSFWHAVKMVSESLWLPKLNFFLNSALHFTQRDTNKRKFIMHHEFAWCSGEKEATPSCPKGISSHHSLLLDPNLLIQSPLSATDIGLTYFCLDFVLVCHDTSPDLATRTLAAEVCRAGDQFEETNKTCCDSTNHQVPPPLLGKADCFRFLLLVQWCCEPQNHKFTPSVWKRRSDHRRNSPKDPISPSDDPDPPKGSNVRVNRNRKMLGLKHKVTLKNPIEN